MNIDEQYEMSCNDNSYCNFFLERKEEEIYNSRYLLGLHCPNLNSPNLDNQWELQTNEILNTNAIPNSNNSGAFPIKESNEINPKSKKSQKPSEYAVKRYIKSQIFRFFYAHINTLLCKKVLEKINQKFMQKFSVRSEKMLLSQTMNDIYLANNGRDIIKEIEGKHYPDLDRVLGVLKKTYSEFIEYYIKQSYKEDRAKLAKKENKEYVDMFDNLLHKYVSYLENKVPYKVRVKNNYQFN